MNRLGHPRVHHRITESTNDIARALAERGAPHGTTVTADDQTAGRGRQGRSWVTPPGSALLISVVARPAGDRYRLAPLAAALAVAETCELLKPAAETLIKWPNDVWIDGRKVAGILVEARPDPHEERSWLVIGIGLNTSVPLDRMPADLQKTAATLGLDAANDALTPLLERLDHWLESPADAIVAAWRTRDALRGRRIAWANGEGTAEGVDGAGNLVVALDDGTAETLSSGEVHLALI